MTVFGVPVDTFMFLDNGNDNANYLAYEQATERCFLIEKVIGDTKYANFTFSETLIDVSGYADSNEAKFTEGLEFLAAGLVA